MPSALLKKKTKYPVLPHKSAFTSPKRAILNVVCASDGYRSAAILNVVCAGGGYRSAAILNVVCAGGGYRSAAILNVVCAGGGYRSAVSYIERCMRWWRLQICCELY